jgi:carbamoyl-phosphate synthase large subunit
MKQVLVTGAGAVLGQGILRSIRNKKDGYFIHTADPDPRSTGHWLGDKAHTIALANDKNFIAIIEEIIEKEKIDAILIGTDAELPVFSQSKEYLEQKYPVKIIASNEEVIRIANDKWLTAAFLKDNNFEFPLSYMTGDAKGMQHLKDLNEYPYIAKPIDGARSKGLVMINTEKDLNEVCSYENNLVVQEYISGDDGEYTSGCLVFDGKCHAVVTLKRDLRDGNTYRAYFEESYKQFDGFIEKVSEKLNVFGPSNFQFRIRNGVPVIFEINSRFSGTTPIRDFFGFNEVIATLEYVLENKKIEKPVLKEGLVMRAWSDIFVDAEQMRTLKEIGELNAPACTPFPFYN